jgi:hypothetical protein
LDGLEERAGMQPAPPKPLVAGARATKACLLRLRLWRRTSCDGMRGRWAGLLALLTQIARLPIEIERHCAARRATRLPVPRFTLTYCIACSINTRSCSWHYWYYYDILVVSAAVQYQQSVHNLSCTSHRQLLPVLRPAPLPPSTTTADNLLLLSPLAPGTPALARQWQRRSCLFLTLAQHSGRPVST